MFGGRESNEAPGGGGYNKEGAFIVSSGCDRGANSVSAKKNQLKEVENVSILINALSVGGFL